MSWLGDLLKFEGFNAKHMLGKAADNPEQLLLGAADPFGAKLWSSITGKDYSPIVNEWGGATDDAYTAAQAAGINTGPGRTGHNIAQTIAAMYAGNYGANQLGGLFGGGGAPAAETLGGQATSSTFIPGQDSAFSGYAGRATAPSSVNLANAGGTMSTGGMGNWTDYMRQAGDAAGAAQQMGLLNFGGNQQQAPAVSLQARGDPVGEMLSQQAQLEAIRRKRKGLLG